MHRKNDGRELKHRQVAFKAESVADDGTFKGYASVFGNVDSYREIVAAGAFADSLKEWKSSGDPLPVLWQHRSGEPIGGSDVLKEDKHGLYTEGFLLTGTIARAREAHELLKRRVVKGLSIGYYVREDSYDEKERIRTLKKLELVEYSIVTFPANSEATVDSVKSLDHILKAGRVPTLPEFEDFLCEAGFSRTQAKAIAGHGLRKLLDQREADGGIADALQALKAFRL